MNINLQRLNVLDEPLAFKGLSTTFKSASNVSCNKTLVTFVTIGVNTYTYSMHTKYFYIQTMKYLCLIGDNFNSLLM